ncbi:amidohydrolase family protein [Actinomycetospora termitidis]|uniref:Amidohydrolase family protein n=1 Tax=Actinomycetospora termitidis TaxID=3053470 RepID=A0ABT7M2B9_9PSEU|nr:amidohydrolase family protein [Actinomycetospora sp. Odt1-22]MDL5154807.1 amidohydrolase family protein [Actinomycetospora sp. Odt1-22]
MADLLLTDVLPRGYEHPVDVRVEDGRIAEIAPDLTAPGATTIDGGGRPVLPGLVEPHLHLDKAMLGGGDGTLEGAVRETAAMKERFTHDDVVARAEDVLRRAIRHGTTLVRTPVDVDPTVGLTSIDALLELKERWAGTVELQVVAFPQEGIAARPGTHDLLVEGLRRGADVIGGCSYAEDDVEACREHVRQVFDLAERFDVDVDIHADFAAGPDDPRHDLAAFVADVTAERGWGGRTTLGHVTTMAGLTPDSRRRVAARLAEAGVGLVVLPPTDLYLQGRAAPVAELLDAGVATALSSNNVRNAFTPFGTADMLDVTLLAAHTQPFGTAEGLDRLVDRGTAGAAAMLGVGGHDLTPGSRADLVVLDAPGVDHHTALLDRAPRRFVVSGGRLVAETMTTTTLHGL